MQHIFRQQRRRVVAHVARSLGLSHLALAEDAVQAAALRALELWPLQGVPGNPSGWLYRVARNHAVDTLRQAGRHQALPEDDDDAAVAALAVSAQASGGAAGLGGAAPGSRFAGELDDEELALLFSACHPRLPAASQVALALRAMAGLDLSTLAAALLCSEAALAQRLARAREALTPADLRVPAGHELAARREAVLTTLALAFHTGARARARAGASVAAVAAVGGQSESTHPSQGRGTSAAAVPASGACLCWEAIRLARALAAHPAAAHPDADALAALLVLHGARLTGQVDDAGHIVLLPGQPRDRWDAGMVRMGLVHLQAAQAGQQLSRWHLQAGIAAEHAVAVDAAATRWPAIVGYYELLLQIDSSAAPRLGHAIALAEAGEPARALLLLAALQGQTPPALQSHCWAAQARACERLGDTARALVLLEQAAAASPHAAEARALRQRARAWALAAS